jgi:hypothetical protein
MIVRYDKSVSQRFAVLGRLTLFRLLGYNTGTNGFGLALLGGR